jgi:hypothetical protein
VAIMNFFEIAVDFIDVLLERNFILLERLRG